MKVNILYEDEYILALDKPSGLLVHSDGRSKEKTLVDWINENYPDLKEVGEEQTLQNGEKIKNRNIILIDDVITTGTTMNEASKTLIEAGAKKVIGFSLAH